MAPVAGTKKRVLDGRSDKAISKLFPAILGGIAHSTSGIGNNIQLLLSEYFASPSSTDCTGNSFARKGAASFGM